MWKGNTFAHPHDAGVHPPELAELASSGAAGQWAATTPTAGGWALGVALVAMATVALPIVPSGLPCPLQVGGVPRSVVSGCRAAAIV